MVNSEKEWTGYAAIIKENIQLLLSNGEKEELK